ncbi:MAG: glycosyltransferase family 2 protein, partial [Gammaproteobacteria bacterium]|nr:glycosyltransferase family 2 protein [Gammaproteobacteria bacterium]
MPNDRPKVSVIIANRNYGCFVGEAIQSALDQDYPNLEVIVVDDGSTDQSRTVIDGFGRRIVKIYREWRGQTASLNVGFAASHGRYVVFLDADDTLCRDAVSILVTPLIRDRSAAKSQGYMAVVDSQGRKTGERIPR